MPLTIHPQPPGFTNLPAIFKNTMKVAPNNEVWIGFRDIGLGKYDGTNWVMYDSLSQGLPSNNISSIDFTGTGSLWAGTANGAVSYDGINWSVYNTINSGLPGNNVTAVDCKTANIWVGTNAGVAVYDGSLWTSYTTSNSGLLNDTITTILTTPSGAVWIGTWKGLCKFENNIWTDYDSISSVIPSAQIHALEYDVHGNLWISGQGIFVVNSAGQVLKFYGDIYTEEFPISMYSKTDFAKDLNGRILFRVIAGIPHIFRFDNLSFDMFQLPNINYGPAALGHCLELDSNNQIWFTGKRDVSVSSLVSMDLNSYVPDTQYFAWNFDNYNYLDISDVKTFILNRGDMHWDLSNPKYEVPKGSGKHSVFASALWIGGLDAGGDVHLAAQTYRQTGLDFWPGPISGISIPFDSASCENYNKTWKISKWEVEAFKDNFASGAVTNGTYAVPKYFLSWPAKGNNYVTDDKAPFFDNNGDNLYNPYDGDYPLIKGDQMIFWMFNDSLAAHTETGGPKIGLEVHASAYAYSCPGIADSNIVMNRTTLYNFKFINRSNENYTNFFTGFYCDADLGNAVDDYIGCDTTIAAGFIYNGDNNDETFSGYGLNPPMQNVVILKGHLADPGDNLDNNLNGIIDEINERTTMNHFHAYQGANNTPTSNPNGFMDFYNYLQSIWLDGIHVSYGGDGRNSTGIPPSNFLYSGIPYDTGWTEFNAGNPAEDRRFLISTGPVSFPAGGELTLDFAYVFTRDSINPNGLTTSVARNIADVQRIHSWFNNDNFPSCEQYVTGIEQQNKNDLFLHISPNPASDYLYADHNLKNSAKLQFIITDILGREISIENPIDNVLNIQHLTDGIYFLRIEDGKNAVSGKFIKKL